MSATKPAPFHVGLTPDRVVAAAADLTRESHLMSWSIRDLAGRLGVAASVIYHHVGGKDLLCRAVVEHMLTRVSLPDPDLPWQQWFRTLLASAGPAAAEYPGTAKWMLMHGPTLPAALPIFDAGMAALERGGFGDRVTLAYAALLNNAMLTVSIGDDRLQHEDDGPRDHAAMMAEFTRMAESSPRMRAMGEDFIGGFAQGGENAQRLRWDYYAFIVENTIAGLEATALPRPTVSD